MSQNIDYSKGIYDARQLGAGRMLIRERTDTWRAMVILSAGVWGIWWSLHHQTDIQRIEKRLKALFVTKLFKHIKK